MLHIGPNNNEVAEEDNNNNLPAASQLANLSVSATGKKPLGQPQNYYYDVWAPQVTLAPNTNTDTQPPPNNNEQAHDNIYYEQRNVLDAFSGYSEYFGEQGFGISGPPQVDYYSQVAAGQDISSNYYPYYHHPSIPHPNYNTSHSYYMRHHQYSPVQPHQLGSSAPATNAASSPLEEYLDLSMPLRNPNLDPPYYQFQEEAQSLAAITPLSFKLNANNASAYSAENNCYESPGLPHYGHVRPSDVINPDLYNAIHNPIISYTSTSSFPVTNSNTPRRRKASGGRKKSNGQGTPDNGGDGPYMAPTTNAGGSNPPVVFGPNGEVYQKPPYSYAALISRALRECEGGKLTLSGIYEWIKDQFPYYRTAEAAWQVPSSTYNHFS